MSKWEEAKKQEVEKAESVKESRVEVLDKEERLGGAKDLVGEEERNEKV